MTSNTEKEFCVATENNLNSILSKKSSPDHFKEILSTIHENGASDDEILTKDDVIEKKLVAEKEKVKKVEKETEKVKEKDSKAPIVENENDSTEVVVIEEVEIKEEVKVEQNAEVTMELKNEEKDSSNVTILSSDFLTQEETILEQTDSGTPLVAKKEDANLIQVQEGNQVDPKDEELSGQPMEIVKEENKELESELNLVHSDPEENQNSQGKEDPIKSEEVADPKEKEESIPVNPIQLESSPVEPLHVIEVPSQEIEVHQIEIKEADPTEMDQVVQIQKDNVVQENGHVSVERNQIEDVNPIQRNCQIQKEKAKEQKKDETDGCVGLDRACLFETEDSTSNHDTTIESIECMPETPVISPIVCLRRSLKLRDEKRDKNDKRVSFDPLTLLVTNF
jgi:hypothetical protein